MYLSSSQQCNAPNGQTPIDPQSYAASNAATDAQTLALAKANSQWQGILRRDWRSFAGLGPQVAFQVMNAPIGSLAPAVFNGSTPTNGAGGGASGSGTGSTPSAPPSPVGVQVISAGEPGSSSGGSGSGVIPITAGRRRPADSARVRISQKDASAFVQTFGRQLSPFTKYTGPLPPQGTAMSLTYGGSPSNRPASVGTAPPSMPQASAGYWQGGSCPGGPGPVASLPWGEPDYGSAAGGSAGAAAGSSWWMWGLLGLGIVGLAWADKSDKKHGRTKL